MTLDAWQAATLQLIGFFGAARVIELGASAMRSRMAWQERGARPEREPWWPVIVATHAFVLGGSLYFLLARGSAPVCRIANFSNSPPSNKSFSIRSFALLVVRTAPMAWTSPLVNSINGLIFKRLPSIATVAGTRPLRLRYSIVSSAAETWSRL